MICLIVSCMLHLLGLGSMENTATGYGGETRDGDLLFVNVPKFEKCKQFFPAAGFESKKLICSQSFAQVVSGPHTPRDGQPSASPFIRFVCEVIYESRRPTISGVGHPVQVKFEFRLCKICLEYVLWTSVDLPCLVSS